MPSTGVADLARMRDQLFFDRTDAVPKLSRFWVLLVLATLIATAGIIGDSTATVIGAMIVAPLMTPILGMVLGMATADARNLGRSALLVISGTCAVIAIAWAFGHLSPVDVVADTNAQVAGRVHPRLIDLVAALATGAVGAFALSRSDVSDTLPGVAIAISLVPPLAVVGLTLEAGATKEAYGAMLLFLTNVGAILLSGLIVMAIFQVGRASANHTEGQASWQKRGAVAGVVLFVVLLSIPLGTATLQLSRDRLHTGTATDAAKAWAAPAGWDIDGVDVDNEGIVIRASGPLPPPPPEQLRRALDDEGLGGIDVKLKLVPQEDVELPAQ
jgi:uncharacterized hydrophobic protein (TIGR00271 family)